MPLLPLALLLLLLLPLPLSFPFSYLGQAKASLLRTSQGTPLSRMFVQFILVVLEGEPS